MNFFLLILLYFINNVLGLSHLAIELTIPTNDLDKIVLDIIGLQNASTRINVSKTNESETFLEDVEEFMENQSGRITTLRNLLSNSLLELESQSIISSDNKRVYKNTLSGYGIRLLNHLSRINKSTIFKGGVKNHSWRVFNVPEFIRTGLMQFNPIVLGLQQISNAFSHDATTNEFLEKSWAFNKETSRL